MEHDLRRLIAHVGTERYAAAREHAWRSAAGTGKAREPGPAPARAAGESALGAVVHDLVDLTWDATERPEQERLALALALYRDLPSYDVLMYGTWAYREFTGETWTAFWAAYRALLADPDARLAAPVAYSLWCDYFEDPETVHDAWQGVDPGTLPRRGLGRLLEVAGPVPWALKAPVYQRLLPESSWHPAIFRSLLYSRFDVYGQIDATQALRLLNQLRLTREAGGPPRPGDDPVRRGLAELRARLETDSRQPAARQQGRPPRRARD
jgi:hypothetical protein